MNELKNKLHNLPKTEIHVHLEGAIPLEAIWKLLEKYGEQDKIGSFENLKKKYEYSNFSHFLQTWVWQNSFLREYEDFSYIAEAVAQDMINQNIIYIEAFYSPVLTSRINLDPVRITEEIRKGFDKHKPNLTANLILDFSRDQGPDEALKILKKVKSLKSLGVIGIGIGGSEHMFPPEPFKKTFNYARDLGYKTTAHAGEASGPKSIWGALNNLNVDRIGHGTRAIEDQSLLQYLKENAIPIEMCPISNCRTNVVNSIKEHPIKKFMDQGILVSVNTDDPKMFNTNLVKEYEALIDAFDLTFETIKQLEINSVISSWASEKQKQALINQIKCY